VVRPHAALCAKGLSHRMAPLLLVGPPGIGKTKFARTLACALGLPPPVFISIAAETNGSRLGGSSTFWSNASPGDIFEALAWGHRGAPAIANGLLVIDEIDKVSTTEYDPLGALYNLLEVDTAREFVDQALPDVLLDASHLHVISTANNLEAVPLPIRSRMLTFEIEAPEPGQAAAIVRQMFEELVDRLDVRVSARLPAEVVSDAASVEPRQAKLLLEAALANALIAERDCMEVQDWLAVRAMVKSRHRSMGFVASP
jgi:MoxR-like ATPase